MPLLKKRTTMTAIRVLSVDGHVVDSSYDFTVKSKVPQK